MRVLVVEDESLVALMVEESLQRLGCTVVGPAPRLARGLALAQSEALDGALLDVDVCGEAIYPVAEALARRGIPFVFATGYERGQIAEEFRDRPVMRKPFTNASIRRALAQLREDRQSAAQ